MAVSSKCLLLFISLLLGYGVLQLEATADSQPYRTSYHFQPPKNWMNGAVRGNKVWGHSTSTDLANWTPHEAAIYPSQQSDISGYWSSSTMILLEGRPVILYTGIDPNNLQVQNLAMPKNLFDPFLREWVKSQDNPLMAPNSYNKINSSSFRDPTTGWLGCDGYWRVIIGSKINQKGLAILYKSKDFVHWEEAKNRLYSSKKSDMWECPDFYPVLMKSPLGIDTSIDGPNTKHVLKDKDIFIPDNGPFHKNFRLRYDYGKFYASKTFFEGNSKHRRILWGWVNESSSVEDDIKKGWFGVQAIPRSIWLDNSGKQLVQWPIKEIETLRLKEVNLPKQVLKGGSVLEVSGVTAAQADVIITFETSKLSKAEVLDPSWTDPQLLCSRKGASVKGGIGPFGLLVLASKGLQECTAVFYRIFKSHSKYVTTYGAFVDVDPVHEKLSLRSLIDHSIVESFGGEGKACITARADVIITFETSELSKAEGLDPSWTDPQLLCSRKGASVKGGIGPFGLLVLASKGLQECAVFYRIFKSHSKYVTTYGAFVDVDPVHEKLSLRSLIDHSIVESFGGEGKACITARVYPIPHWLLMLRPTYMLSIMELGTYLLIIIHYHIDHSIVESFGGEGKACITARVYPIPHWLLMLRPTYMLSIMELGTLGSQH
ncbi:beta-fructofuranosidase [Quercus suber]|uniref:Beta-fructofuranosidase n=1 Tax=Quercus suber TaxID=58331 RepID=A0AAW0LS38_QUESU